MSEVAADIQVEVEPAYQASESAPAEQRYVFSYTITVHNRSMRSIQLLARHWQITQSSGKVQEVRGKGVVGQQPLIGPGQRFRYTSRAVLDGPVGVMEGSYTCLDTTEQRAFEVPIAAFRLAGPNQIH
ncbi:MULTISPECIES: Co2+/Mg2+ efflux protein ApaG [Chromohalobacter]|uniref:Protein ApaG n=1 Tax=Chromohalobacter moromii TaxID=2860329 RepID=A0A9X2X0M0_9GAMM|nr:MULTISPECIES: Co2+/Mg2+ efflux protein ApaG [Chromohalobacter]MCK0752205.1 Co2+/Mg2+ efflux protein ApaG [Chromohalobacter japonicus]MCK2044410.1 Co2+/Mg2+ efflux protein ApaG [Chromohalobacter moromii]MCT8467391.1 Co2+/Mg2+ efflux protein ApaG [Chromohalobacter canadensis]MCT8470861.1 Co2+/Mg2+ efflux protein ApaG [Chromohalobacter canadensis]MCT8497888.1 Co2+/Mg2+ efflux protein ApaG [Chromohalobacter canadensis]